MAVIVFWIDNDNAAGVGMMSRPRGGDWLEDDISSLQDSGADVVVCLLEKDEMIELDLAQEQELCERRGLTYISFPIPDRGVPQSNLETAKLLDTLTELSATGRNIVVHCRQGIGRSSMIAAGILTRMGMSVDDAFQRITTARGRSVPDTPEQRDWIAEFVADRVRPI
jgi:protein-tyrosine phosphatase